MQPSQQLHRRFASFLLSLGLVFWAGPAFSQTLGWGTGFDSSGSLVWWIPPTGSPTPTFGWDNSVDAGAIGSSGSVKMVEDFTGGAGEWAYVSLMLLDASNNPTVIDTSRYISIQFDLRVVPGTALRTNGDFGWLALNYITPAWSAVDGGAVWLPPSVTNWTHFAVPFNWSTVPESIMALGFTIGSSPGEFTNRVTLNLDNLSFRPGACCAPPLTLWIEAGEVALRGCWLSWPAYASGCELQVSTNLLTGSWHDTGLATNATNLNGTFRLFMPLSALPSANSCFWRLRRSW
jgi:hypothetical protein